MRDDDKGNGICRIILMDKTRWYRFIFGTPIETEDFLLSIALCLEWLFEQDMPSSKRRLKITCDRRTKRDHKELNEDVGLFFVRR
jgi:DNA segregation ATPase FtsK/SpoIIIE, S-DNA-T family